MYIRLTGLPVLLIECSIVIMVWVSNLSNATIVVQISAYNSGLSGPGAQYAIDPVISQGDTGILIEHER